MTRFSFTPHLENPLLLESVGVDALALGLDASFVRRPDTLLFGAKGSCLLLFGLLLLEALLLGALLLKSLLFEALFFCALAFLLFDVLLFATKSFGFECLLLCPAAGEELLFGFTVGLLNGGKCRSNLLRWCGN